ncbi:hypothetical protein HY793_05330, partial [Candidatus Desantisbacteria bacterium]|nr:hypothetical protein [Candidatus Desantisbacteria bacterium]
MNILFRRKSIEQNSLNNTISQTNTYNGEPIYYYYGIMTETIIEGQNLTLAGSGSTNLGRIVLVNCSNFTIRNNSIVGGIGQNGETGYESSGGQGGMDCGIYLYSSTNTTISGNIISQNLGGVGGRGNWLGSGGAGGVGCGIYLAGSTNNNILENTVSDNQGGQRGIPGGIGGHGNYGQGYGVYSISNSFPIIHYNSLLDNKNGDGTKGYGVCHDESSGTISATSNWWGYSSGPYHPTTNPSGQGDIVSNWVKYQPWTVAKITVTPTFGLINTTVTVEGQYFATNTGVSISFSTHPTITTTQSSPNGTFSTTFIVPAQTSGTKIITATDTEGNLATTTFILLTPTFLKIIPAYNLIAKGQEFDVNVRIEDVQKLYISELFLSFNPACLEVLEVGSGSVLSGGLMAKSYDNANG